jgi:hypothetical protein
VTGGAPLSATSRIVPALREKIASPTALVTKMTRKFRNLAAAWDTAVTRAEGGFDKFLTDRTTGEWR